MFARKMSIALAVCLMLISVSTTAPAQSDDTSRDKIEGTWRATVTLPNGFKFKALETFLPGRAIREGTLISTSEVDFFPPNPGLTAQGSWAKTANREYTTIRESFIFSGAPGEVAGLVRVKSVLSLNISSGEYNGRGRVEIFDTQGNILEAFTFTIEATRMRPEPVQ
jgi:hypothetical protein